MLLYNSPSLSACQCCNTLDWSSLDWFSLSPRLCICLRQTGLKFYFKTSQDHNNRLIHSVYKKKGFKEDLNPKSHPLFCESWLVDFISLVFVLFIENNKQSLAKSSPLQCFCIILSRHGISVYIYTLNKNTNTTFLFSLSVFKHIIFKSLSVSASLLP